MHFQKLKNKPLPKKEEKEEKKKHLNARTNRPSQMLHEWIGNSEQEVTRPNKQNVDINNSTIIQIINHH